MFRLGVDPYELQRASRVIHENGHAFTIALGPWSMPREVQGRFDPKQGRLILEFRYSDDEPASKRPYIFQGIEITGGQDTRKVLKISIPVDQGKADLSAMHRKLVDALAHRREIFDPNAVTGTSHELNHDVVQEILDAANFERLARELVDARSRAGAQG